MYALTHNPKESSVTINIAGGVVVYDTIKQYVTGNKIVDFNTVLQNKYNDIDNMDEDDYFKNFDMHEDKSILWN